MDTYVEGNPLLDESEQALGDDKVSGTAYWQKLGDTLGKQWQSIGSRVNSKHGNVRFSPPPPDAFTAALAQFAASP